MNFVIKSRSALVLGAFFAAVTARTIFDDVWHGSEITVAHLQAGAALVAAIASGHFIWPALKQGRLPAVLGLLLIFVAATVYIVTSAGARNAEVSNLKAASILKTNEERASLKAKVTAAEADVDEAKAEHDKAKTEAALACKTGDGPKCKGTTKTRNDADLDVQKAEAFAMLQRGRLSLLGPEQKPFEGYAHAAKVFEAAGIGVASVNEARLTLLMPFALVLISEVGTLVFLGMALGHRVAPVSVVANDTGPGLPQFPQFPGPEIVRFPQKHKVIKALESQRGPVSNSKLAELLGETEGEASKSWREVQDRLEIGRQGKELRIQLRRTA